MGSQVPQPDALWTLWLKCKTKDNQWTRYFSVLKVEPSTTVDAFIQRLVSEVQLGVHAAHVRLRLLPPFSGDEPSEAHEKAASELHPRRTLRAAGVEDGSSLLSDFGSSAEGILARSLAPIPENKQLQIVVEQAVTAAFDRLVLQSQKQRAQLDTTPTALGHKTLEALRVQGTVHKFQGDASAGAPVLDDAQQERLALCTTETELVKLITPVLWRLRVAEGGDNDACRAVLVNSENFHWLDNVFEPLLPSMRLKPDLFMAPRVCIEEHEGNSHQGSGNCYLFGRLAGLHLQRDGCVRELYEAKLNKLVFAHFGELVMYHRLIPGECRGMLFNGSEFWLFASYGDIPLRLVQATWTAPGSAQLVRSFFVDPPMPAPPLVGALRQLLSDLRLRPALPPGGPSCFLGGGASGRVFAVRSAGSGSGERSKPTMALKVVPATDVSTWVVCLTQEFRAMQRAAQLGAPVVGVVADSLRLLGRDGGGYLLARCGKPYDANVSPAACAAAFAALAALHTCGVVHGDARLPNLLSLDGVPAWVDLSPLVLSSAEHASALLVYCRDDAQTLAGSTLRAAGVDATAAQLPAAVAAAVAGYDARLPGSVSALADAVWTAARGAGAGAA